MRRFSAVLLLAIFSASLIGAVVLPSDSESKLPVCCRREGKHRCAFMQAGTGPALRSAACPMLPCASAAPVSPVVSLARAGGAVFSLSTRGFAPVRTESPCGKRFDRAWQQRGPPLLHS